jgi:hypothetical protein
MVRAAVGISSTIIRRRAVTQNAGHNQGGINKATNKSADRKRKEPEDRRDTEARPLDPGTRSDGGVRSTFKGGRL